MSMSNVKLQHVRHELHRVQEDHKQTSLNQVREKQISISEFMRRIERIEAALAVLDAMTVEEYTMLMTRHQRKPGKTKTVKQSGLFDSEQQ